MSERATDEAILRAPKALLHDHLDGGVRPTTVVDLAAEYGYAGLPTTDVDDLSHWFHRGARRNDLVLYLETFDKQIQPITEVALSLFVNERQSNLPKNREALYLQLMFRTYLVSRLQQSRTKNLVNFNGRPDDLS
jgi:adenosine deaminase